MNRKVRWRARLAANFGYSLWLGSEGDVMRAVSEKALETFKQRIRRLISRICGRSITELVEPLRRYVLGWKAYFGLAQRPCLWRELDAWMRHRLRAIQLKHWKRGTTAYRECIALGAKPWMAQKVSANCKRWWFISSRSLNGVLTTPTRTVRPARPS